MGRFSRLLLVLIVTYCIAEGLNIAVQTLLLVARRGDVTWMAGR